MSLDLEAIKARARAVLPGPWVFHENTIWRDTTLDHLVALDATPEQFGEDSWPGFIHNSDFDEPLGEFIAHAREDVPALVAEVERLRNSLTAIGKAMAPEAMPDSAHVRALVRAALS